MSAAEPAATITALPGCEGIPARGAVGVTIGAAIPALLASYTQRNFRPAYIVSLRRYLNAFAKGRMDWALERFGPDLLEKYFDDRQEIPVTRASNIRRLNALFAFAVRRQYLAVNPIHHMERMWRIDHRTPKILSVHQCAVLMDYVKTCKPGRLGYFSLALFCGIRPEELARLTWSNVRIDEGVILLDASCTKTRRRRIIYMHDTARKWVELAIQKGATLPVSRSTRVRYIEGARVAIGLEHWPHDCLRHTAASQLVALHRDISKVSVMLGHSSEILRQNYLELVSTKDCEEFWQITPSSPKPQRQAPKAVEVIDLPVKYSVTVPPHLPRFARAELALKAEPTLRLLARQRQRECGYQGAVTGQRVGGEPIDTIKELGGLARCSKGTIQMAKHIVRHADETTLVLLRRGSLSIQGVFRRLKAGAGVEVHRPGPQLVDVANPITSVEGVIQPPAPKPKPTSAERRGAANDRRTYRDLRKAVGLCIQCCQPIDGDGYLCKDHKEKRRIYDRDRYRQRVGLPLDAPLLRYSPHAPAVEVASVAH